MNKNQIRQEVDGFRNKIPSKKNGSIHDRIKERARIYTEIYGSQEFRDYKTAIDEDRLVDAASILNTVPEDRREYFLHCYKYQKKMFDEIDGDD